MTQEKIYNEQNRIIITKTDLQQLARYSLHIELTDEQVDETEGMILERLEAFSIKCIQEILN